MALAITITDNDCSKHLTIQEVAKKYMAKQGLEGDPKRVRTGTCYNDRFVEVEFDKKGWYGDTRRECHTMYRDELAELIGCDCAVVGQSGTEWYVCGFNK